jgi:hypothetical protein
MITLASVDLALGIINSAVKLGKRADLILVEQKLGDPLPIMLPPLEADLTGYLADMKSYFTTGDGKPLLADDKNLAKTWTDYLEAGNQGDLGKTGDLATRLIKQWALFTGQVLPREGKFTDLPPELAKIDMIQFYLVDAAKPGHQRSAIIDISLAAADVVLEFAGANPALFTKDPVIQKVIATFLVNFTKGDLEKDPGYRQLFERALGSVIHTAIEHRDLVEDEKALSLFLEALAKAKEADDGDFVADLVGGKGFDKVLQSLVKTLGENLDRFTKDQVVIDIIGGILNDAAEDAVFKAILAGKDGTLATVVQIAISHTAKHPVLLDKIGDDQIWHSVLKEVLTEVASSSEKKKLFTDEVLGSLISAALRGVAQDKELLADGFVARLAASVADSLSTQPIKNLFGESSLKVIASAVLESAAEHVDLLVKDDKLLASVFAAVMKEGAKGFAKGFDRDFAIGLAIAAIDVVAANASAIKLPGPFGEIVGTIIKELSRDELRENLVSGDIVAIFTDAVQIAAANPHLWEATLANGKVPASVIRSIAKAVAADPTQLLSGPVLGSLVVEVLDAVSLRAKSYATIINEENEELSKLLTQTLDRLKDEVGVNLGADNIVAVITQMVLDWGKDQFLAQIGDEVFEKHIKNALLAA